MPRWQLSAGGSTCSEMAFWWMLDGLGFRVQGFGFRVRALGLVNDVAINVEHQPDRLGEGSL